MALSLTSLPQRVKVVEVGPRDGLQNEKSVIPTEAKIHFINLLSATGLKHIEATSFVSPRAVPQLADASEVLANITRRPGIVYSALVPNMRGMERALAAGVGEVAVFTGATETFVQHNINASIAASIENFRPVAAAAKETGLRLRGYVSTAFGCPYEGAVAPEAVVRVTDALFGLGADEVSIGDTIGVATPQSVIRVTDALARHFPLEKLAMHFHDTRGTALANVLTALQLGITVFDSSAGGLGGCPYAPGASGNLATEDLLYMLHGMGIETDIDLPALIEASRYLAGVRAAPPASRYYAAATAERPA